MSRSKPPPHPTLFPLDHPPAKPIVAPVEAASEVPKGTTSLPTEEAPSVVTPNEEPPGESPPEDPPPTANEPTQESQTKPNLFPGPPLQSETWMGYPIACSVCGEVLPTLKHLELVHDSHGEGLHGRLLAAYLWPQLRLWAETLLLSVAQLRYVILSGGISEMEKKLSSLEAERKPR